MRREYIRHLDGSVEGWDHDLAYRVWKANRPLDGESLSNIKIADHPLVGKTLVDTETGEECVVESVNKQFHAGWYFGALLRFKGNSHSFRYFHNESSMDSCIIKACDEFWKELQEA